MDLREVFTAEFLANIYFKKQTNLLQDKAEEEVCRIAWASVRIKKICTGGGRSINRKHRNLFCRGGVPIEGRCMLRRIQRRRAFLE